MKHVYIQKIKHKKENYRKKIWTINMVPAGCKRTEKSQACMTYFELAMTGVYIAPFKPSACSPY